MELGYTDVITDNIARLEYNMLVFYLLKIIKSDSIIQKAILTLDYLYE